MAACVIARIFATEEDTVTVSRKTAARARRLARRSGELGQAVPQVMATRIGRMLQAGPLPSRRDQLEARRMVLEKFEAFGESGWSMAGIQQQYALWWMQAWWKLALGGWMRPRTLRALSVRAGRQLADGALDVALQGLAPVHRRVVANARRLRRSRKT